MRIISKFHDYYDGVQNYGGYDSSIIFKRETSIKLGESNLLSEYLERRLLYLYEGVRPRVIGCCGKFYLLYYFYNSITPYKTEHYYCYSYEELINNLKITGRYNETSNHFRTRTFQKIARDFETIVDLKSNDIFFDLKSPIFIYQTDIKRNPQTIINPCLKAEEFYRIKDSFTMYQELSMYLGGVLSSSLTIPYTTGSDDVIRDSKGFDSQSFKTASPGKKAARRNKNM